MAAPANDAQTPVYGDKGAKLRNFHQKHRPPQTFVELVGDEKKSMDHCPINGVPLEEWGRPVQPISDEAKEQYTNRKKREREKKDAVAKGAILKKRRVRKKRSHPSGGGPPVPQPDATAYAPATALPALGTPTTQSSTSSDGHPPSTSLPRAMAQPHSTGPPAIPAAQLDHKPPPVPMSLTANLSHQPASATVRSQGEHTTRWSQSDASQAAYATGLCPGPGRETPGGTPSVYLSKAAAVKPPSGVAYAREAPTTKYMMSRAKHASRTYLLPTTTQAYVAAHHPPLLARRSSAARADTILSPDHSTPGSFKKHRQHPTSGPYSQAHVVRQGPCAPAHIPGFAAEWTYATDGAYATPSPMTTYAGSYGETPSLSPTSTRVLAPESSATPSSPHIATQLGPRMAPAGDSMRGTGYFPIAAYQGVIKAECHSPADTKTAIPTMRSAPVEYCHPNTVQQTNGGGVPQANPTTTTGNAMAAVLWHSAEEQGPQDVHNAAQSVSPPPGKDWSVPSPVLSHIDRQRSGVFKKEEDDDYAHRPHAQTPALPQTIVNVNAYPPKQSSYSELSHALQYPTPALMETAPPRVKNQATSPRSTVPPVTDVGSSAHSSNGASSTTPATPYAQGAVINEQRSGINTHFWRQEIRAPPQYHFNRSIPTSTVSPRERMVETDFSTHIDPRYLAIHYGQSAPA